MRSLDPAEREYLHDSDIHVFTMSDIDRIGIERTMREALDRVAGPGFVHVSLDLDSLDPEVAPGVGTPVRGGLTYREAHLACELIAESGIAGSLEVVEANPILDRGEHDGAHRGRVARERARPDDSLVVVRFAVLERVVRVDSADADVASAGAVELVRRAGASAADDAVGPAAAVQILGAVGVPGRGSGRCPSSR